MKNMSIKEITIRSIYALVGVLILAFGVTVMRIGNVGLDPFTSANIALGEIFGLSLGVYQLGVNIGILFLIFLFGRKYIGTGTIINMVLAGFFIDMYTAIFAHFELAATNLFQQTVCLIVGVLFFTFGASFYMSADVGAAPYDSIAPTIVDKTNWDYKKVRMIQDISFALVGFFFHGPIGVGTFINAFLTGPFITFWDTKISQPLIAKSVEKAMEN